MSAPDLVTILSGVQEDVNDFIAGLRKHGPDYAKRYAEFMASSRQNPPARPSSLPAEAAAVIRESVLEQAAVARMGARRRDDRTAA